MKKLDRDTAYPAQSTTLQLSTTWGTIEVDLLDDSVMRCRLPLLKRQPDVPFRVLTEENDASGRFIVAALTRGNAEKPAYALADGTDFQRQAWQAIARIPNGKTQTYGELAKAIGRPNAYRAVANACGKNPIPLFIPCHRVVAANGKIGGFAAGLPWKKLLLSVEQT